VVDDRKRPLGAADELDRARDAADAGDDRALDRVLQSFGDEQGVVVVVFDEKYRLGAGRPARRHSAAAQRSPSVPSSSSPDSIRRRARSTICGSHCVARQVCNSSTTSPCVRDWRYSCREVITSIESATATMRAPSGMAVPANLSG